MTGSSIPIRPFGLQAALVAAAALLAGYWAGIHLSHAHDLLAYWNAAGRLLAGERLFPPEALSGPIPPFVRFGYLYPPPLAIAFVPFRAAGLDFDVVRVGWAMVQTAGVLLAAIAGLRAAGAQAISLPTAAALVALPVWWFPQRSLIADGNVGGLIVALVALAAMGPIRGGIGVALAAATKVSAVAMVPLILVRARSASAALVATALVVGAACLVIAPQDTLATPVALANLAAGAALAADSDYGLATTLRILAGPEVAVLGRPVGLGVLGLLVLVSIRGQRSGRPGLALASAAWATLFVSGTIWMHYLVVAALPIGLAWPRASAMERTAIVIAAVAGWAILLPPAAAHIAFWVALAALAAVTLRAASRPALEPA